MSKRTSRVSKAGTTKSKRVKKRKHIRGVVDYLFDKYLSVIYPINENGHSDTRSPVRVVDIALYYELEAVLKPLKKAVDFRYD